MVFIFYMMVLLWSNIYLVMPQEGRFGLFGPKIDESFTKNTQATTETARFISWDILEPIPAFDQKKKIERLVVSKCLRLII